MSGYVKIITNTDEKLNQKDKINKMIKKVEWSKTPLVEKSNNIVIYNFITDPDLEWMIWM